MAAIRSVAIAIFHIVKATYLAEINPCKNFEHSFLGTFVNTRKVFAIFIVSRSGKRHFSSIDKQVTREMQIQIRASFSGFFKPLCILLPLA